jgi:Derlin-2/3
MGGDIWKDLLGIAAGHLYHFLKDILVMEYNFNPLKTPQWLHRLVARFVGSRGAQVPVEEAPRHRIFFGGGGYRLGGN